MQVQVIINACLILSALILLYMHKRSNEYIRELETRIEDLEKKKKEVV